MSAPASDVAFTPAVKAEQTRRGSRHGYARMEEKGGWSATITPDLAAFIAARDSFYLSTASADGQPYTQHRGGPPGFVKVLDERTLAFADFRGNRQYITAGNLSENPRAFIFLMDYPNRSRVKMWGRAKVVENAPALMGERRVGHPTPRPGGRARKRTRARQRSRVAHTPRLVGSRHGITYGAQGAGEGADVAD